MTGQIETFQPRPFCNFKVSLHFRATAKIDKAELKPPDFISDSTPAFFCPVFSNMSLIDEDVQLQIYRLVSQMKRRKGISQWVIKTLGLIGYNRRSKCPSYVWSCKFYDHVASSKDKLELADKQLSHCSIRFASSQPQTSRAW